MTISLKDFTLLQKMMAATFSDNDGESLSAIRQANKVLERNNINWEMIFKRVVSVDFEASPDQAQVPQGSTGQQTPNSTGTALSQRINNAFNILLDSDLGSYGEFIESLKSQWDEKHYLTENQRTALFKSVDRQQSRG